MCSYRKLLPLTGNHILWQEIKWFLLTSNNFLWQETFDILSHDINPLPWFLHYAWGPRISGISHPEQFGHSWSTDRYFSPLSSTRWCPVVYWIGLEISCEVQLPTAKQINGEKRKPIVANPKAKMKKEVMQFFIFFAFCILKGSCT